MPAAGAVGMSPVPGRADWAGTRPWVWGLVFGSGMAFIAVLEFNQMIVRPWNMALVALFSLSLWPLARSAGNKAAVCGVQSGALAQYNRRVMQASFGYVAGLGLAVTVFRTQHPEGAVLGALPSVPVLYGIWAVVRYMAEETDEFLRHRTASAALFGLGLVMVAGTCWGFLEMFGAVPHVESWWVVPVWAIGMGLGQVRQARRLRDERES
jgi:hypothetical protein